LHVEGHHYGEVLADKVFEILEEYEICEKLFCITADNAGNNGTMCTALSILLKNIGIEWDPKKYQISCMNHVINLAVQEFIKSVKVMIDDEDDDEIARELQEGEDNTPAAAGCEGNVQNSNNNEGTIQNHVIISFNKRLVLQGF
jgi:hypothetical protein